MNDDELIHALSDAMRTATATDEPSARLTQALVRTRVGATRHPYLVPIGATAVVTALTAGGFVVADLQGSPTTTTSGDTISPSPPPTTAAAPPTTAAAAPPTTAAAPPTTAAAAPPTTAAAPPTTAAAAPPTTAAAPPTTAAAPPTTTDDTALFARAASYSVTEKTISDPTLPDASTTTKTVTLAHDGSKSYYAQQQELTWDDLAQLPTGTEAFRTAVTEPGHPPNAVEKGLQELVQAESPLPWPQRRAAMAVAMTMPGATVTQDAKDADGRPAVQVTIETSWMLDSYYFDPTSFRLLEAASFVTPEWEAHWTPIKTRTGQTLVPLGTGSMTLYSGWTITPKG